MKKSDSELAKEGIFEFMTVVPSSPLIGDFRKHYITKQYKFTEVDPARRFFCSLFDDVLAPLNREKLLRPYFCNYPLTFQDMDLQIVFVDENNKPLLEPYFCSIRKVGENIVAEQYDSEIQKSVAIVIERADRALRITVTQGKGVVCE